MKTGVVTRGGAAASSGAAAPAGVAVPGDLPTRQRVVRSVLENGPSTVAALAERLALTATAVRRHLEHLLVEGVVEAREQRVYGHRGRGRPAKVFAITDAGRARFAQQYDDLAVSALRFLEASGGTEAVARFAQERVAELERRYRPAVEAVPAPQRATALAEALSADGYAASVRTVPTGDQLCQHHCPVAHVATEFPQLCEAETRVFARLLDRHVQRLATIAHGDGVCTTHLPNPPAATPTKLRPTGRTAS